MFNNSSFKHCSTAYPSIHASTHTQLLSRTRKQRDKLTLNAHSRAATLVCRSSQETSIDTNPSLTLTALSNKPNKPYLALSLVISCLCQQRPLFGRHGSPRSRSSSGSPRSLGVSVSSDLAGTRRHAMRQPASVWSHVPAAACYLSSISTSQSILCGWCNRHKSSTNSFCKTK